MHGEGAPLGGGGVEVPVLHMEVASADCLGAQPVEQRHLRPGRDAEVSVLQTLLLLRRLRDHFDALRMEDADVTSISVEHF